MTGYDRYENPLFLIKSIFSKGIQDQTWKIPRPIDLTKYIGKIVKIIGNEDSEYYSRLRICDIEYLNHNEYKSIKPLTSEDINPND